MNFAPSNGARPRRNEEMKFAYAGPFARLLHPIRPVKPRRDLKGDVFGKQPRYTPRSPESWTIGSRIPAIALALEAIFGREYGSVLDEVTHETRVDGVPHTHTLVAPKPKRRRRRGSRGARKPVAS